MLTLKKLKFSGIGRFVDEQEIDFTCLPNLVQVDGFNKNTGGSSGAGKSTVFNALDYLLGLNDIPNGVLQSRLTKDGIRVEGEFDHDGKKVVIIRSKKGLSIEDESGIVQGSSKLAEEKLDCILAIPRPLFRQILHKRQDERGFFLKLTPKEIHEFLTDALELESYQAKIDHLEDLIKAEAAGLAGTQNQLKIHEASLEATKKAKETMGEMPAITIGLDDLRPLREYVEITQKELAKLTQKQLLETGDHDLLRPKVVVEAYDRSKMASCREQITSITAQAQEMGTQETARQQAVTREILLLKTEKERAINLVNFGLKAKTDAQTVAAEIKTIRSSICPTCQQSWTTDLAKKKEEELIEKLKGLKQTIDNGLEAEKKRDEINAKIADLEPKMKAIKIEGLEELLARKAQISADLSAEVEAEKAHTTAQLAKSQAAMNEWTSTSREIANRHAVESQLLRQELEKAKLQLNSLEAQHKSEQEAFQRWSNQSLVHAKNIERWELAVSDCRLMVTQLTERAELLEDAKKAIKSFMSCSFEDALQFISDASTNLIRNIPNMANATISIEGTKETAKGAVKEEVNAVLNVDGEEAVPLRSLSGGERTSVDIAVDLAVIDLVQTKANKGINVFVLDEPFTGLENINIEPILEILRQANIGKKVFIVDHNPIIKESIHDRILVVREGAESNLNN